MKLKDITNSVKGFFYSTSWKIEKHTPEILLAAGIITTIAAVATTARAAIKAQPVIEEHKKQIEVIRKCEETGQSTNAEDGKIVPYTKDDAKKDTRSACIQTGKKLAVTFALPAAFLTGSIVAQVCGYKVLSQRLAAAAAAYSALASKFKAYRQRVAEKYGVEEERNLAHGIKANTPMQILDENGNPINDANTIYIAEDDDYTALFSQFDKDGILNPNWSPDCMQNLDWLRMEQDFWNATLKCRKGKPVFLNEIRERLRVGRTQKAQAVGWVYKPDDPNHVGDNYIDFGLDPLIRAYRNGEEMPGEASILLDFNVDGNVV